MAWARPSRRSTPGRLRDTLLVRASAALLPLMMAGCGGNVGGGTAGPPPTSGFSSIAIEPDTLTLSAVGEARDLEAVARTSGGGVVPGISFTWSSSNSSVATVDGEGVVTAVSNGTAAIEAVASGITGRANVAVRAGDLEWLEIRAGGINGCGVTSHGTAYCWGDDVHGQIGDGTTTDWRLMPVRVRAGLLYFHTLTIGGGHVCGLTSDGIAHCWGNTFFGEGGYGVSGEVEQTSPVAVSGGQRFSELRASGSHTCGLTVSGAAWCWGVNDHGQLGDGTTTNRDIPVAVVGGLTFRQIDAPRTPLDNHTCAVATDGAAWCWGTNFDGELGDGTTEHQLEPVAVAGGIAFDHVSAGGRHTCGMTPAGAAWCWGANGAGALGDGTALDRSAPTAVTGGIVFLSVSAGESHTCGLATGGTAYCWGANSEGQLGDGTNGSRAVPTPVSGGLSFVQLEAGPVHTCGLTTAGVGYCWGRNTRGELGNGSQVPRNAPVALPHPDEIGG